MVLYLVPYRMIYCKLAIWRATEQKVTIHQRSFQVLATKLYNVHRDVVKIGNVKCNFRDNFTFATRNAKSVYYGSDTFKKKLPPQVI